MTNVILEKKTLFIKKIFGIITLTSVFPTVNSLFNIMVSTQQCLISPYDVVAVKGTLYLMVHTVQYCLNLLYLIYCSVALNLIKVFTI